MAHLAGQLQAQAVGQCLDAKLAARVRREHGQRHGAALRACTMERFGAAGCVRNSWCRLWGVTHGGGRVQFRLIWESRHRSRRKVFSFLGLQQVCEPTPMLMIRPGSPARSSGRKR